ncbi:NAD-dependent histone deacetylase SIR2 [Wallemia ichthyophaga EXF-994]|uniref:NAD-dependent histone deacetylase SIR2 n=1 Tax=Wallemia ichthyophaga (strain EXF-994 / CBS 113033) TaxID=1299270 RepID=R9AGA9_WALI9|nr:NAD-dependent histone deacetylase SIR2 [Wallemia ichthyophaga EXF-994]EOR01228.1 NAD-dependent histone deacetylase SIR2 [Wallemia ichthyophaga EXF-994]
MHHDDGTDGTDKDLDNNSLRSIRELGAATFIKRIYDDDSTDDSTDIRRVIRDLDSECTGLERKSSVQLKQLLKRKAIQIGKQRSRISIPETYDAAINLISISSNILVVSGAGISVNRGIPDFRSPDGIYDQIKRRNYPEIDEPEQIFDLATFVAHPRLFYSVAKNIMPTHFSPGPAHKFVKALQDSDTLLRNYTQNIGMSPLERKAGVDLLLECHGTFAFLECLRCGEMYNTDDFSHVILGGGVPVCTKKCIKEYRRRRKKRKSDSTDNNTVAPLDVSDDAVITFFDTKNEDIPYLKPTITFFGEDVHSDYEQRVLDDSQATDLILVLGTSMSVAPISEFISHIPHKVPIVVINKTPIKGLEPDVSGA